MTTNVLLISDTVYDTNGVSRFIQDMAAQARRQGMNFSVLSASPLANQVDEPNIHNIAPFVSVRMPYYREQFLNIIPPCRSMYRFVKQHRPDVIHISTPGPLGLCAMFIAWKLGIPTAGTYHTDFPSYLGKQMKSVWAEKMTRWVMRRFYRRMAKVFSRSGKFIPILESELRLPRAKLIFLPPGSDTEKFNPSMRDVNVWERFDVSKETLKLLYVGRLSVEKNFMDVIDLFGKLQQKTSRRLSMIVIGEGVLDKAVRKRDIPNVHLLGVQRGVALSQLYASSDMMLFASVTETLGQVVMEAQASVLPCIVSDQGGVTDIVMHEQTGYCLEVGDTVAWMEKSLELIEHDKRRVSMGRKGYEMMKNRSIGETFRRFMEEHARLLAEQE